MTTVRRAPGDFSQALRRSPPVCSHGQSYLQERIIIRDVWARNGADLDACLDVAQNVISFYSFLNSRIPPKRCKNANAISARCSGLYTVRNIFPYLRVRQSNCADETSRAQRARIGRLVLYNADVFIKKRMRKKEGDGVPREVVDDVSLKRITRR